MAEMKVEYQVAVETPHDAALHNIPAEFKRLIYEDGVYLLQLEAQLIPRQAMGFIEITRLKPGSCLVDINGFQLPLVAKETAPANDGQISIPESTYGYMGNVVEGQVRDLPDAS